MTCTHTKSYNILTMLLLIIIINSRSRYAAHVGSSPPLIYLIFRINTHGGILQNIYFLLHFSLLLKQY